MEINVKQIKSLMRALRRYDFSEIEIRQGDEEIVLRRHQGGVVVAGTPVATAHLAHGESNRAFPLTTASREVASNPADAVSTAGPSPNAEDPSVIVVTSPLVGTFYRSPSPAARPFVEPGSAVRKGSALCIIEAMKLMNEIECELDGTVVEVLVENGKPVEFGEKLFKIRKHTA